MNAKELLTGKRLFPEEDVLSFYRGKICLVTGALGTIGRALVESLSTVTNVRGIDFDELRVSENPWCELGDFIDANLEGVDVVFHAAAYKHVVLGEKFTAAVTKNNLLKTEKFVTLCPSHTKIVFISTDKASGKSVMGATKQLAEEVVIKNHGVAVRLVNVAKSRGSVLDLWDRSAQKHCAPREVKRYFFQLSDCVQAILKAGSFSSGLYTVGNLPLFTLGELASYYEERGCVFFPMELRPGEVVEEKLIDESFEKMEPTSCPYLFRIERT